LIDFLLLGLFLSPYIIFWLLFRRLQRRVGKPEERSWLLQKAGHNSASGGSPPASVSVNGRAGASGGGLLDQLSAWVAKRNPRETPLDPSLPRKGFPRDPRWNVIQNADVEGEL